MKYCYVFAVCFWFFSFSQAYAQQSLEKVIFTDEPVNFNGDPGKDAKVERYQGGRIIYKKVEVPDFPNGTDVTIKLKVRSNGDRWDKSGSCFVVTHPDQISIIDVSKGEKNIPWLRTVDGGLQAFPEQ